MPESERKIRSLRFASDPGTQPKAAPLLRQHRLLESHLFGDDLRRVRQSASVNHG